MTLFGITSIITFFTSIGFGLIVYSSNRRSKLNKSWLILSIFIAFWSIFLYKGAYSQTENSALLWLYCLDFTAIFIPILYLNFIFNFLEIKKTNFKKAVLFLTGLLAIFSFSPLFKLGVVKTFDFYWVDPGKYYFLFPTFFIIIIIISLLYLIKTYLKNKKDYLYRGQIRNQIIAGFIGFSGGITNFFPQLFNIYPFGNYFIILYVFFVSYAILKYKFLNTKIISAQLFSGAMALIFLFNFLKPTNSVDEWMINFALFVMMVIFVVLLNRSIFKEIQAKRKIELLAEELEKANIRLKKLDQQKSDFVSVASHQLRAPIASIKGYSSMVMEGSYGPTSEKISEIIKRIFQSSSNLAFIVDDFLNLSRIERGKIEFNFVKADIKPIVQEVVNDMKHVIEEKGLKMKFELQEGIFFSQIDPEKIRQIVTNLIDNSIKYTPKGSIHISLSKKAHKILLKIQDTGIGLPKKEAHKIFKKFIRLENANSVSVMGTGLGLYLVKEIVKAHGGKVWAESEGEGKGSTFFVQLKEEKE